MVRRVRIRYQGTVQGVGFRPHIYRLAKAHQLGGWVNNDPGGVTVEVEGEPEQVERFLKASVEQAPVLSRIKSVESREIEPQGEKGFVIRESERGDVVNTQVSPDSATCPDCLRELFDPKDRRYRYPFINCTNCGPRYTIIEQIPYDRPYTTMKIFKMCPECEREYHDPMDRRFHAQPNACPVCGPRLVLLDRQGREIPGDAIQNAIKLLKEGKIIAVKSLGGYQLACDALNEQAVKTLRQRKIREDKPFALMAPDLESIEKYAFVSPAEKEVLLSPERPIVLLKKRESPTLAPSLAPNQKNWGFMLPYTPLHHLLLKESQMILVMTSGNLSDEPIAYKDEEAMNRLKNIADYFLTHNRPIYIRCDDSVVRVFEGKLYPIRRARGYVPRPLELHFSIPNSVLAVGAQLKNTFALTKAGQVILSHHIGDLDNLETLRAFEEGIEHLKRIFEIEPELVVYDLHPDYLSTQYALSLDLPGLGVQHHYAHTASVMAEHNLEGPVIGVSFDGTGYGTDRAIWGGEFLIADYFGFERKAHLEYIPMPGGEKAIKEPWRMALVWLERIFGADFRELPLEFLKRISQEKAELLLSATQKGINAPLTSSMGRLFDAMSALLNLRLEANYEGQPAIELEMLADEKEPGFYPFEFYSQDGVLIIDPKEAIKKAVEELELGEERAKISARFHNGVCRMVIQVCEELRRSSGINQVALSGGVFQNFWLLSKIKTWLEERGFEVFVHHQVPTNDGGISLGQAVIGLRRLKDVLGGSNEG